MPQSALPRGVAPGGARPRQQRGDASKGGWMPRCLDLPPRQVKAARQRRARARRRPGFAVPARRGTAPQPGPTAGAGAGAGAWRRRRRRRRRLQGCGARRRRRGGRRQRPPPPRPRCFGATGFLGGVFFPRTVCLVALGRAWFPDWAPPAGATPRATVLATRRGGWPACCGGNAGGPPWPWLGPPPAPGRGPHAGSPACTPAAVPPGRCGRQRGPGAARGV
jgi:hypothetical protein